MIDKEKFEKQSGHRHKHGFTYNFTCQLDTSPARNSISGTLNVCTHVNCPAHAFPLVRYDVLPVFGYFSSRELRSFPKYISYRKFFDNPLEEDSENIQFHVSVRAVHRESKAMFKLSGALLKFYTTDEIWEQMSPGVKQSLVERERKIMYADHRSE